MKYLRWLLCLSALFSTSSLFAADSTLASGDGLSKVQQGLPQPLSQPLPQPQLQFKKDGQNDLSSWLVFICALLLLAAVGYRYRTQKSSGKSKPLMHVEHRMMIGNKQSLVVVRVGEKNLLLGVTPQNISLIQELDEMLTYEKNKDFSAQLAEIIGRSQW